MNVLNKILFKHSKKQKNSEKQKKEEKKWIPIQTIQILFLFEIIYQSELTCFSISSNLEELKRKVDVS